MKVAGWIALMCLLLFACGASAEVTYTMDETSMSISYISPDVKTLTLPEGVEIENVKFESGVLTGSLRVIEFPEGMERVPYFSYRYNEDYEYLSGVEELVLPASMSEIRGIPAMYSGLQSIRMHPDNPHYTTVDGILYSKDGAGLVAYPAGREGAAFAVPEGVEWIGGAAFSENDRLKSISLPRTVTRLENYAFARCTALESISLPLLLTEIGNGAFAECITLREVVLPQSTIRVGGWAFEGCYKLKRIVIPNPDTVIPYGSINAVPTDIVVYAPKGSWAHRWARSCGWLWAEVGGTPVRTDGTRGAAVVVNNPEREDTLAMYSSASENSRHIAALENGTTLELLGWEGDWAQVVYGAEVGYVRAGKKPDYVLEDGRTARALAEGEVYRPPKDCLLVVMAPLTGLAETVEVRDISWPIELPDGIGERYARGYFWPSRDAPGFSFYDSDAEVIGVFGEWLFVRQTRYGYYGYVPPEDYWPVMVPVYSEAYGLDIVYNPDHRDRLNLRAEPSPSSRVLGKYYNGTQVEILSGSLDEDGWRPTDWVHVRISGQEGYVDWRFLRKESEWEFGF